jgi:hypothetical protein
MPTIPLPDINKKIREMKTRGELITKSSKWWGSLSKEQKIDLIYTYDRNKSFQSVDVIDITLIYLQMK